MKIPRAHFVWAQLGIYSISGKAQYSRKNTFFNPRTGGGGVDFNPPPPLRFFADSEKTAARSAAKFAIAVQPTI